MRISRIILLVLVVIIVAIVGLYALGTVLAPPTSSSTWHPAAGYPLQVNGEFGVAGQQCGNSTNYVYCVGGVDTNGGPRSQAYSSSAISSSSGNITSWSSESSPYPQNINGQSCVTYSGNVYCVGGSYDDNSDDVASSYYAPLGNGGVLGKWNSTTPYPIPIDSHSCVTSSGYIYCVGGNNETDGTNADSTPTNSVWYAQLSGTGIGTWNHSTAYPKDLYFESCAATSGLVYCVGGADSNSNAQSSDYYATLSQSGVGTWTQTTAYPLQASGQSCVILAGYIYCVGGQEGSNSFTNAVYYAAVSGGGIETWKQAANYPLSVATTCADASGYIFCVGGFDSSSVGENNAVYFASVSSLAGSNTG